MRQHFCRGDWAPGAVAGCSLHDHRGAAAADVRPYNDARYDDVIEGVAKTGQVSKKGTVEHRRYWSGRQAAKVTTGEPIRQKANEMPGFTDRFEHNRNGDIIEKESGRKVDPKWLISKLTRTTA